MASESATSDDKPARPMSGSGAFPIVGIGASAGGLEAFSHLLRHRPVDSGMAFVLVQHIDRILINVTSFFRGPETFELLKQTVFPSIVKTKTPATPIRFWVPGCSTLDVLDLALDFGSLQRSCPRTSRA